MKTIEKSLTEKAGIIVLGRVIAFSITFFIPIFMVRIFSQENFGIYKQAFLIPMTLVPILGFSLGQNIFYFFPREPVRQKALVLNILWCYLIAGVLTSVFFIFYPSTVASIFKEQKMVPLIPWIGAYVALLLLSSFFENVLVANGEVTFSSVIVVISDLVRAVFLLSAALISKSILLVILAAIGFSLLRLITFLIYISMRLDSNKYMFEIDLLKRQLQYSFPYGLEASLYSLRLQLHNFFVAFSFDARMFAIYSIGVFQLPIINIVRQSVGTILTSELSRLQYNGETDEMKNIFTNAVRKLSFCFFPLFFFMFVIKKEFIIVLFTKNYLDSIPIFAICLFNILMSVFISDPIFRAFPIFQPYKLKVSTIFFIVLPIVLYLLFLKYGLIGVVLGNLIIMFMLEIVLFKKCVEILSYSNKGYESLT